MGRTLGVLYPGRSAEDDFARLVSLLDGQVALPVQHTAMEVDAHRLEHLLDWGRDDRLAAGAQALAWTHPDAVVWACTSGSFAYGWEGAHAQVRALSRAASAPATSTSLAFVRAAQALGVGSVAVVASYPGDVARLFVAFLEAGGIEVAGTAAHGVMTAAEVAGIGRDALLEMAAAGDHPDAEAVLLPDTALHTADHLDALEERLGKCVLTANQVSVWDGLRLCGYDRPSPRLGSLFRLDASPTGADQAPPRGAPRWAE